MFRQKIGLSAGVLCSGVSIDQATCYPPLMSRFGDDGAIPVGSRVVVDRNVVTSQGVGTAIEFGLALVEQLYCKGKMEEVAGPLYVRPQQGVDYIIHEYNPIHGNAMVIMHCLLFSSS